MVLFRLAIFVLVFPLLINATDDSEKALQMREILKLREGDIYMGNKESKVVIVNYSALSCPHCAEFHKHIFPKLKEDYIDNGKILYIIRDFPSNSPSLYVGHILHGDIDLERKIALLNSLFNSQMFWVLSKDHKSAINSLAMLSGIDEGYLESIEMTEEKNEQVLKRFYSDNEVLQINATPAIYINGKFFPYTMRYEKMVEKIEGLLS